MDNTIHSDLIRGHIDTIILKALYDGDRYGFDIIKEIEQKSSGQYIIKQPTLYSCLKRLEVQGFIKSYWGAKSSGGRRKYFTLTDMGRDLFIKNQSEWVYSRSVIDKLISDKDFDFSTVAAASNGSDNLDEPLSPIDLENGSDKPESEEDEEVELEEEDDHSEEFEISDNSKLIEEETVSEEDEILTDDEQVEEADEETEATIDETDEIVSEPVVEERPYLDTTAIMNEMFDRQLGGRSYTEKLKNDDYIPTQSFDPNNYFNDNFNEPVAAAQAVPDEAEEPYDTDEIIRRMDTRISQFPAAVGRDEAEDDTIGARTQDSAPESAPQVPATAQSTQPAAAQEQTKAPDFYRYDTTIPSSDDEATVIIKREYKNILLELRDRNIVDTMANRHMEDNLPLPGSNEETLDELSEDYSEPEISFSGMSEGQLHDYKIRQIETELKELGDGVKIRKHSTVAAKEYTNTYYYYSNKLMLSHYLILFLIMIPEIAVTFLAITLGSATTQKYSILFLVLAVVVAALFPAIAFVLNMLNPLQKKRIKFSFKISMIFRFIVMIEALVLVYTVNLMMGMPLTFDSEYLITLLVPGIMCTNIPISAMIFQSLYKSGKYNIDG